MAVVSTSHPVGYGKTRPTVLGKMASIRRVLPEAQITPQASRDLAVLSFLGNRMTLAVPFHTLSESCATEPCLEISGRPLISFLRLTCFLREEPRRNQSPLCWAVPSAQPCLDSLSPSRSGALSFTLACPPWMPQGANFAFPAFKSPLESKTGCLQKRSLDFCNPGDR